jgi:hypothetical protein
LNRIRLCIDIKIEGRIRACIQNWQQNDADPQRKIHIQKNLDFICTGTVLACKFVQSSVIKGAGNFFLGIVFVQLLPVL